MTPYFQEQLGCEGSMSQHDTLTLREALRSIQYEAASLADAQVIALQALNATYPARAALSATQPAQAAQSADERAMLEMIDERDRCHEWADQLASAIAEHTCHEIGEHTSANNPWRMALNALECHERQDTTHEAGARIKDLEDQAAQGAPVKPLFASKVAARKWAELQEQGARMQSIAFDGGKGGAGTIDPWGVVRWDQAAQGAPVHEMVQLSGRIKELITAHGTLRAASRSLGIDVGYLSRLERGEKVSPSPEVLAKLGLRDAGVRYERLEDAQDAHEYIAKLQSTQEPVQAAELLLQGGLTNEQLREAFGEKMPGVVPSDRDLTLFALGIEVGAAELADERRMKKMYFDERNSARDAWRRAADQREEARAAIAASGRQE